MIIPGERGSVDARKFSRTRLKCGNAHVGMMNKKSTSAGSCLNVTVENHDASPKGGKSRCVLGSPVAINEG